MATQVQRSSKQDIEQDAGQHLLRWRWLAVAVVLSISVPLEILEDHQIDLKSIIEISIYVSLAWLLLTVLGHRMMVLSQRKATSELRSQLVHDLTLYRQFDQLAQYIVAFPATFLPIDHASLFLYDHLHAQLEFAQEWNAIAVMNSPVPRYLKETSVCQTCLRSTSPASRHTSVCAFELGIQLDAAASEYCLPLKYDKVLVGMLRMRCRTDQRLTHNQLDFLQSIAPEITLALANSIGYARQVDHTRREAQNRERQRLTHELHDSLAQRAFYLQLALDQLSCDPSLVGDEIVRDKLERLRNAAAELNDEIRRELATVRAGVVPDLSTGLRALADELAAHSDLRVELSSEGDAAELSIDTIPIVLGLVREGLNNVVRHAQATCVHIAWNWSIDRLTICLDDDGQGFDPESVGLAGHYGLAFMREKARMLHGELTITSAPRLGTHLQFCFPLPPLYPAQTHPRNDRAEAVPVKSPNVVQVNVQGRANAAAP